MSVSPVSPPGWAGGPRPYGHWDMLIPAAVSRTFRGRLETSDDRRGPRRSSAATAQHCSPSYISHDSTHKCTADPGASVQSCTHSLPALSRYALHVALLGAGPAQPSPAKPASRWCRGPLVSPDLSLVGLGSVILNSRCAGALGSLPSHAPGLLGRTTKRWAQEANQKRCFQ